MKSSGEKKKREKKKTDDDAMKQAMTGLTSGMTGSEMTSLNNSTMMLASLTGTT
jgi:hypothetical protein